MFNVILFNVVNVCFVCIMFCVVLVSITYFQCKCDMQFRSEVYDRYIYIFIKFIRKKIRLSYRCVLRVHNISIKRWRTVNINKCSKSKCRHFVVSW